MKTIGIALLAYGDEHIFECQRLIKFLSKYDVKFYVTTDTFQLFDENIQALKSTDPFNYNLKRRSIDWAFENDIVLALDTDVWVKYPLDFSILNDLPEGLYVPWIGDQTIFKGERITIDKLLNNKTKSDINNRYVQEIYKTAEVKFIDEYMMMFILSDNNKKVDFIYWWNILNKVTEHIQPNNDNPGAMEGLIIYASAVKSGIEIFNARENLILSKFFDTFYHYTREPNKKALLTNKKTII